ncbi:hypothetical protein V8E53_013422 [Lactarius tabidus]
MPFPGNGKGVGRVKGRLSCVGVHGGTGSSERRETAGRDERCVRALEHADAQTAECGRAGGRQRGVTPEGVRKRRQWDEERLEGPAARIDQRRTRNIVREGVARARAAGSVEGTDLGCSCTLEGTDLGARETVPSTPGYSRVEAAVRALSPAELDSYLSLHNSHNKCLCHPDPLQGIFATNSFAVGTAHDDSGICLRGSRFNHSCSPNARHSFNSNTGELEIHALGTIPCGDEICIAYISSRWLYGTPRRSRQAILRTRYHFTCVCSVCSLPEAESKMSDARRHKANELLEIARRLLPTQEDQCLNVTIEALRLVQEEGYLDDAIGSLPAIGRASRVIRELPNLGRIACELQRDLPRVFLGFESDP